MAGVIDVFSDTHVGHVREGNEDAVTHRQFEVDGASFALLVVCDGMGGHAAGEVASSMAVDIILTELVSAWHVTADEEEWRTADLSPEDIPAAIGRAITLANERLLDHQREHPETMGMGTTVTLALVAPPDCWVSNVGDSRAYVCRAGELMQLTEDDSIVYDLYRDGAITHDEIYTHPHRNVLTACLGYELNDAPLPARRTIEPGDRLLLCSDGLWEMVRDPDIEKVLAETDAVEMAGRSLVNLALSAGGVDNISVALAYIS